MKIALCYKGFTYTDFKDIPSYGEKFAPGHVVDFLNYIDNHKLCIINPLSESHTVDIYVSSYYNKTHNEQVNAILKPKDTYYRVSGAEQDFTFTLYARHYVDLINMAEKNKYDYYIFSRTDTFYTSKFTDDMFVPDKIGSGFHICWPQTYMRTPVSVDDSILIVPKKHLPRFKVYVEEIYTKQMCSHFLMNFFPLDNMLFYDTHDEFIGLMDCTFRHIHRGRMTFKEYLSVMRAKKCSLDVDITDSIRNILDPVDPDADEPRILSLFKVFMSEDVIQPVNEVLMSGYITQGPQVKKFESMLQNLFDYPYIVALNSATSAQTLALRMIKDHMGCDNTTEVLSTPLTCMATNEPIIANGMKIKWVDVDLDTGLIDLVDLENKITEKTKIITFVHWGGYPVDLDKLNDILDRKEQELGFRPYVIEDCAHAFLSEFNGKIIGTHGNFATFSLQAIKHLTTGDGGLLFCPNKMFYEKAKLLRWYGIDRDKRNYKGTDFRLEADVVDWGYKFHMNDINATIGIHNLPHIEELIGKNRANAQVLYDGLKNINGIQILNPPDSKRNSAYWLFTILVDNKLEFIEHLKSQGIMASQVHQRNDVHTCFTDYRVPLPNLDIIETKLVCIPVGWWLTSDDLKCIITNIVADRCPIKDNIEFSFT